MIYKHIIRCYNSIINEPPRGKTNNLRRLGAIKDADQLRGQLRGNREAGQRLCFRFTDSTIPLLLKSKKFHASSCLLRLYRLVCAGVCVGPVRKPHYWFSQEVAQAADSVGEAFLKIENPIIVKAVTQVM